MAQPRPEVMPLLYGPTGLPAVANIIPRNGWWSGNNEIGQEQAFAPDSRNRQSILKLSEWGPPVMWTVSLFLRSKFVDFDGYNITAELNFGVGGSVQTIRLDWANGVQISLPMNALDVIAFFEDIDNILDAGKGLRLGVQLARGQRSSGLSPRLTLTENLAVGAGAQSVAFPIPAFAKKAYYVSTGTPADDYAAGVTLDARTGPLFAPGQFVCGGIGGVQAAQGVGLDLGGKARFLQLNNASAGAINVSVYVELFG